MFFLGGNSLVLFPPPFCVFASFGLGWLVILFWGNSLVLFPSFFVCLLHSAWDGL